MMGDSISVMLAGWPMRPSGTAMCVCESVCVCVCGVYALESASQDCLITQVVI